ncbi:MAG: tripartite tricarboxylate transporter substrate binding protein [Betaproteobacteria bacterium]|nr:tripartite tricarboxylate transporter substrate binding protein [Betaproteobacteria bacterium]
MLPEKSHLWTRLNVSVFLCVLGVLCGRTGFAEPYPSKTIRIIVPYPAGAFNDQFARALAHHLNKAWGRPTVVENRPGGSTIIATDLVAKAPPDGHTLLIASFATAVNVSLFSMLPFDTLHDLAPVIFAAQTANALVANTSFPAASVKDLIALAKAKPDQINYASGGNGSSTHLAMEMLKRMAGIGLTHVPYKGSAPALTDVMGGQVSVALDNIPNVLPHIKAGRLRALGVSAARRSGTLPEVPSIAESVPGFDVSVWFGVMVPAKTPKPIVAQLNAEINRMLASKDIQVRFNAQGVEVVGGPPEKLASHLRSEIELWGKLVKSAGIKPE